MTGQKPRLWAILVIANLIVVLVPLAGIWVFRLYEGELLRRTESALISQSVLIREMVVAKYKESLAAHESPDEILAQASRPVGGAFRWENRIRLGEYRSFGPRIDLSADDKRPPLPEASLAREEPDPLAQLLIEPLNGILKNSQHNLLSGVRVLDHNGVVVASTANDLGASLREREEVDRALRGEPVSLLRWRKDGERPWHTVFSSTTSTIVFVGQPIVFSDRVLGAVVVSRTPTSLARALMQHRTKLAWYGVTVLVVLVLSAFLTAGAIAYPIRRLIAQVERIRDGGSAASLPLAWPGSQEVEVLSRAIAEMARALEARSHYIRDFSRALSHEFKTPIASIRGSVELLLDHASTMTEEERIRFLAMIDRDATRMQRLVQRLMELVRAEMVNPRPLRSCALREVVETLVAELGQKVILNWTDVPANAEVALDAEHLRTCFANLFDNAQQHGGPDVTVTVIAARNGSSVRVAVANNGLAIPAEVREQILSPFFTTARESGGTGLGLSIVRALLEAAGGRFLVGTPATGAEFVLVIPLA